MLTPDQKLAIRENIRRQYGWTEAPKPQTQRQDPGKVAELIERYGVTPAPQSISRAKAVIDEDGNRYGSIGEAARSMHGASSSVMSNAIRRKSTYRGRRWWFVADAPAHVLRRKVLARKAEAA